MNRAGAIVSSCALASALLGGGAGGCGQLAPGDAATSDAAAEAPTAACGSANAFAAPTSLGPSINTSSSDSDIRLTPDELVAYFTSTRDSSYGDMFVATRDLTSQPFGAPSKVAGMAGAGAGPLDPNITSDQLGLLFFARACTFGPNSPLRLCGASRTSTSEAFGAPSVVNVALSSGLHGIASPYALDDELKLYVEAESPSSYGIATTTRATRSDDFGPLVPVAIDLGDAGDDAPIAPVVTPDELTLFFSRVVSGGVWMATRTSTDAPFTNTRELTELEGNSPSAAAGAYPNWVSPDGCRLYFTAPLPTDDAGHFQTDIYVASRSP